MSLVQNATSDTSISWLTLSGTPSAGTVEFKVKPNEVFGDERRAYLHFVFNGEIWATVTIIQSAKQDIVPSISASPTTLTFAANASGISYGQVVNITSNVEWELDANWNTNDFWYSLDSNRTQLTLYPRHTNRSTQTDINFEVYLKYSGTTYQTISLTQQHSGTTLNAYLEEVHAYRNAQDTFVDWNFIVYIPATGSQTYSIINDNSWLSLTIDTNDVSGDYHRYLYNAHIDENHTREDRTATIKLVYGGVVCDVKEIITQYRGYITFTNSTQPNQYNKAVFEKTVGSGETSASTFTLYSDMPYKLNVLLTGATTTLASGWTYDCPSGTTSFTITPTVWTGSETRMIASIQVFDNDITNRVMGVLEVYQTGSS